MASTRSINIERRNSRANCRVVLATHIQNKLGIQVHPSQVRLVPKPSDPYRWKIVPEKKDALSGLFSKNICDLSIIACRELCEGVDEFFEAIPGDMANRSTQNGLASRESPVVSFGEKFPQHESENAHLFHELCQWKDKATNELQRRHRAEEVADRLYEDNIQLKIRVKECSDTANCLLTRVTQCSQGLDRVLPLLEQLKAEAAQKAEASRDFQGNLLVRRRL